MFPPDAAGGGRSGLRLGAVLLCPAGKSGVNGFLHTGGLCRRFCLSMPVLPAGIAGQGSPVKYFLFRRRFAGGNKIALILCCYAYRYEKALSPAVCLFSRFGLFPVAYCGGFCFSMCRFLAVIPVILPPLCL